VATDAENVGDISAAWPVVLVGVPSFTRGRVIVNFISGPYGRARARVAAGVFCDHCFDCHGFTFG
jgi:hypothetical protein